MLLGGVISDSLDNCDVRIEIAADLDAGELSRQVMKIVTMNTLDLAAPGRKPFHSITVRQGADRHREAGLPRRPGPASELDRSQRREPAGEMNLARGIRSPGLHRLARQRVMAVHQRKRARSSA